MSEAFDVAIVGGGPAGSTAGTLLKRYAPDLRVLILERETFPRDHVGESQLPEVGRVLNEMGVWDKVEAAGFPIKIGATYKWGGDGRLWDFEFVPMAQFPVEPRPARYVGVRTETAFQVDRAIYDKILLDHARESGCDVREGTRVRRVERDGDRIAALETDAGTVTAGYYLDASGNAAIMRRALGVPVEEPTILQNIAIWDYWQNVAWAENIGGGPTRIQVMSLGWGWIWFIPLGPTRTSVGLVVPARAYKEAGVRPQELYDRALREEPRIRQLLEGGHPEGKLSSTKDWSFVADRLAGPNWFLVGEAAGFADPILSAGMTLAHTAAREAAYTILSLERGEHDPEWLRNRYSEVQSKRIRQHMRFAEFWYAANGIFTDLKAFTAEIAAEAGLKLDANEAFYWLSSGGFTNENFGGAGAGFFSIEAVKQFAQRMTGTSSDWAISRNNVFRMDVKGARRSSVTAFHEGRIYLEDSLVRDGHELPFTGLYGVVIQTLHRYSAIGDIAQGFLKYFRENPWLEDVNASVRNAFHTLEAMIAEGWVVASLDPTQPGLRFSTPDETLCMHLHTPDNPVETG
ncbi:hypothetical protein BH11ARM2_BH11ARM2_38700 [soil metagenome]